MSTCLNEMQVRKLP